MENRAAVRAYLKKYFQTRSIGSGKKGKGMTMKNRQKKVLSPFACRCDDGAAGIAGIC